MPRMVRYSRSAPRGNFIVTMVLTALILVRRDDPKPARRLDQRQIRHHGGRICTARVDAIASAPLDVFDAELLDGVGFFRGQIGARRTSIMARSRRTPRPLGRSR